MKKNLLLFSLLLFIGGSILAQAPQAFKYQAIARDASGNILSNQQVSLRISLLQGNESGNVVYSEIHNVRTNDFGLISLEIGNGDISKGDFEKVDWALSKYYVGIDIDINGGTAYERMGASQLLSVPYALYAENAGNTSKNAGDAWVTNVYSTYLESPNSLCGIGTNDPAGILDIAGEYYFPGTVGMSGQVLKLNNHPTKAAITSGALEWSDDLGAEYINELYDGKTGGNSLFLGTDAGLNDDGSNRQNLAIGNEALMSNTSSNYNTAIGYRALYTGTTAYGNTAIGANSLYSATRGDRNIAIGHASAYSNTSGIDNVAIGFKSSYENTNGHYNVRLGNFAGYYNDGGMRNTVVGYNAGKGTSTHKKDGNVFLGYQAGYNETGSNKLYIENSSSSTPLVYGEFDNNLLRVNGTLNVNNAYSFPTADGTNGQIIQTDGSGALSWTDMSTATQTALDGKQASITGAATTITTLDLTASRALISNSSGKVAVSDITSTELAYLDGVSSNIQTQLDDLVTSQWTTSGSNIYYNTGNVGIGTSAAPSEALDVSGNIKASGTIQSGNSIIINGTSHTITSTSGVLSFGDEELRTSGRIGIGVTSVSPSYRLQISGDISVQGTARITGAIRDQDGSIGSSGQVLSSTGTRVDWIDPPSGSSGLSAYGYMYHLASSGVNNFVAGGADVVFSSNGPLSGCTHTAGTTTFTVPTTGDYKIDYNVNITAGVGAAIAIAVNGVVNASTNKNLLTATGPHSGTAILWLAAGDVLTLRNNSAVVISLSVLPDVGAQFNAILLAADTP
jgi:hypothetical protein